MVANVHLKDVRYHVEMYHYLVTKDLECHADPMELVKYNTTEWFGRVKSFRPMYMLGSQPNGGCYEISFGHNTYKAGDSIQVSPKFTFIYDYPAGTDLDKEQQELEKIAAESYRIWASTSR